METSTSRLDSTAILVVAGTATQGGAALPFTGSITIGTNHQSGGVVAGGSPICKQRIVTPIPAPVTGCATERAVCCASIRAASSRWSTSASSRPATATGRARTTFSDGPGSWSPRSQNLFSNLHSTAPYTFSWSDAL